MKPAETPSIPRIEYLDAMRGIAIIGVLVSHIGFITRQSGDLFTLSQAGNRGVQLFYLVSALTLFTGWHGKRRNERDWLTNFLIRRFFRIAPAFYAALAVSLCWFGIGVRPDGFTCSWIDVGLGALLLHGFSASATFGAVSGGWSVGVEVIFYMLLPALFLRITTLRRAAVLTIASAAVFGMLSRAIAHFAVTPDLYSFRLYLLYFSFPIQMPVFGIGISVFFLMRTRAWKRIAGRKIVAVILLGLSCAGMAACIPLNYSLANLWASFLAVVPLLISAAVYPLPLLVNRVTIFLGKISYSFYLVHFFVIQAFARIFPLRLDGSRSSFFTTAICVAIISTAIAALSWHYIEQPGISLGRRIIANRESKKRPLADSAKNQGTAPATVA